MIKRLFPILLLLISAACGDVGGNSVDMAERDFAEHRYASARQICDSLILGESFPTLSVNDLCRLSVLMVKLADHSDEEANFALAAKCMQLAMERDADSVADFVQTLPIDEQSQSVLIQQLTTAIEHPWAPDDYHQHPDSISTDSIE